MPKFKFPKDIRFRKTTINPETNTPDASDPDFIYLAREPDGQYAEWVLTPSGSWEKIGHLAPKDISPEELVDSLVNQGHLPLPPLSQSKDLFLEWVMRHHPDTYSRLVVEFNDYNTTFQEM